MKKAKVQYNKGGELIEATVVENMGDYESYGVDCVDFPSTLRRCIERVPESGPVVINPFGGMCNLLDLSGDNSNIEIYEV